jgi:type IV secretory pathway VirD2 relaxase
MILSPEFGERLDLRCHTRELLTRMERDLGVRLEWVAVAHFNTDHPHVHVALRGQTDAGPPRLGRDYIKQGIRGHAEELCTAQLGFRTELDAIEADRREADALRITSLDRRIAKYAFGPGGDGAVHLESLPQPRSEGQRARQIFLAGRLRTLSVLGLAWEAEPHRWQINPAFLSEVRAMQIGQDRQKMMALGGSILGRAQRSPVRTGHPKSAAAPEL